MVPPGPRLILGLLVAILSFSVAFGQSTERLEDRLVDSEGRERLTRLIESLAEGRKHAGSDASDRGEEALRLLDAFPDQRLELLLRIELSWLASRGGDAEAGLEHARRAHELSLELDDEESTARADYHVALAHWYRSDLDEAFAAAERARDAQELLGDELDLAATWTLLGAMHRSRSQYEESMACHFEALDLARSVGDSSGIARAENNIGLIYWKLGRNERAFEYLAKVAPVYRALGQETNLACVLNNLGLVLIELKRPQEALPYLEEGLELHEKLAEPRGRARLFGNLAFAYEELGQVGAALDTHALALSLRESLGDDRGVARSSGCIASIYRNQGRHPEAVESYLAAIEAAERVDAREELSILHHELAESYEALGQYELALAASRRHLSLAQDPDLEATVRRIAELEAEAEKRVREREQEAKQRQHELEVGQQRLRLALMGVLVAVLLVGMVAVVRINRTRTRTIEQVRRSHEDLKRVTANLAESEHRYRSVFEDAVVPKFVIDLEDSSVLDANGPAGRLCGRAPEELRGQPFTSLRPGWLARVLSSSDGTTECRFEAWEDEAGDLRHAEIFDAPLSLAGRECAVVTIHDVTEVRRLEEERARVDRLESLGLLAGGIAHDFNNALAAVLGHVSLARIESSAPSVERLLLEAEDGVQHAAHLTQQLLAFAKGGEPLRHVRDVKRLLWNAVHFSLSGSNVRVEFDVAPDLWAAKLDDAQFKQVISNLVINAVQAMPEGGRLLVSARNVHSPEGPSTTTGPGDYVRIDLEDEGVGIPADVQDKILDPYFTTKESGSGLGLATAFAVVSRHDGCLDFRSVEGEGTTFSLYFPASIDPSPVGGDVPEDALDGSGRILVMDDDPGIQRVFRAVLPELGYTVEVVEDGRAALDAWFAAKDGGLSFDAVIMDLTIPGGMGGKEAMADLRRRDPEAIGIVVSGYSKDPVMANYEDAGFVASLAKPFNVASLGRLLKQVLGSRSSQLPDTTHRR